MSRFPIRRLGRTSLLAALLAALLVVAPGCGGEPTSATHRIEEMYREYKRDFPAVTDIPASDALELQRVGRAVFIDVRPADERKVSMIAGAISRDAFEQTPSAYTNRILIAYCTIGARSGQYAEQQNRAGLPIRNLRGSILAWIHAGGAITNAGGATTNVHVFGPRWNLVPEGYRASW